MYDIKKRPLGIYEKALPNDFTWLEKMQAAKQAGFDYIEISVDESDERLARLDWSDEQIEEIRSYMKETGIIIPSMCLSGHRRFPFGSKNKEIRDKAFEIMEKGIILAQKLGVRVIQLATYDVYYEELSSPNGRTMIPPGCWPVVRRMPVHPSTIRSISQFRLCWPRSS